MNDGKSLTNKQREPAAKSKDRPEVRRRLERDAIETHAMTPEQFTQFIADEIEKWGPIARRVMPGK